MELRHLRYFVAVVEELHFRRAAEKLHIVQPALSKQIRALENELGILLLDRDRRNVSLTEPGRAFYEDAVAILARAENAKSRALATSKGLSGQLSIGFVAPALGGLLQHTLRSFRHEYPSIHLRALEGSSQEGVQRTLTGEVDCAIVRLPVNQDEGIAVEPVTNDEVFLVVPAGHPLAEFDEISLSQTDDEELILIERHLEPGLHDYYISLYTKAGFSPKVGQVVGSSWAALGLVAGGLGICFAPASFRSTGLAGVVYLRIKEATPRLSLGLIWKSEGRSPVLDNFIKLRSWDEFVPIGGTRPSVTH